MARGAAFFDLDRTLLPGSSGPVFAAALRERGVLPDAGLVGSGLLSAIFGAFDLIGETRPTMLLSRSGVRFSKGWDAAEVEKAGELAAARLVSLVQPYARREMVEHRRAGRLNVIATSSPDDLVRPLAAALGFDDVIATRYRRSGGTLDGTLDGHYVWGSEKLAAVEQWAVANEVSLDASWAYSDSWYDLPMLGAVGRPVAVNPDPRLGVAAVARRWPVRYLDSPRGPTNLAGVHPQRALLAALRPELFPYARFDIGGVENIPREGGIIFAANHRSCFDIFALGVTIAQRGRLARVLAKRELFDAPVIGQIVTALGGIPVDRGTGSDEPLRAAAAALEAGEVVGILPQGPIPGGEAFFDPVLHGRPAVARLAAISGSPVLPVAIWGSERVWPRSARFPNLLNLAHPPLVTVRVGEPLSLPDGINPADGTEIVMSAIFDQLPSEAKERREPTHRELARTHPPGTSGQT